MSNTSPAKETEDAAGEKKDASKRNNKRPSAEHLADNHNGGVTDNDPSHDVVSAPETVIRKTEEEFEEDAEGEEAGEEETEEDEEDEEEEEEDGEKGSANQPRPAPRQLVYTRPSAETIIIECSDDDLLEVEKAVAVRMSVAIRKKLETLEPNAVLQLDNITGRALTKVMEYCHVHTAPHIISMDLKTWDDKFVKLDPGTLCELASAAYHLEIKPLVDLTCQAIAQLLKGKSPAEIRRTFNILYDFNPEDDAPPPTMRDKLRNKLCNPKRREKTKQLAAPAPPRETEDTRSVDELVSFINEGKKSKNKSAKAAKRARQRERKKQRKTQEKLKTSQDKEPEKECNLSNSKEKEKEKNNKGVLSKSQDKGDKGEPESLEGKEKQANSQQRHKGDGLKSSGDGFGKDSTISPRNNSSVNSTNIDSAAPTNGSSKKRATGGQQNPKDSKKSKNQDSESNRDRKGEKSSLACTREEDVPTLLALDDEIWEEDEDDMDPELKAQQDREVEEFRMRLEQINNTTNRARIALPSTLSLALIDTLKG